MHLWCRPRMGHGGCMHSANREVGKGALLLLVLPVPAHRVPAAPAPPQSRPRVPTCLMTLRTAALSFASGMVHDDCCFRMASSCRGHAWFTRTACVEACVIVALLGLGTNERWRRFQSVVARTKNGVVPSPGACIQHLLL